MECKQITEYFVNRGSDHQAVKSAIWLLILLSAC